MKIYQDIRFKGFCGEAIEKALIDTGAEISLIPIDLARRVGAWRTNQSTNIVGIHAQRRNLPIAKTEIFFPSLGDKGGYFLVAVSDVEEEPIIGMDVLKPLGISIDTKTHQLSVKNEIWEAFKTLSAIGVLTYAGIKILEKVFEEES